MHAEKGCGNGSIAGGTAHHQYPVLLNAEAPEEVIEQRRVRAVYVCVLGLRLREVHKTPIVHAVGDQRQALGAKPDYKMRKSRFIVSYGNENERKTNPI